MSILEFTFSYPQTSLDMGYMDTTQNIFTVSFILKSET